MELNKQEQVEALKAAKPYAGRLKELGQGVRVDKVWGRRLLVQPVTPFTEMDAVEKKGILVVPEKVKEQNTPRPSTGIVVKGGEGLSQAERCIFYEGVAVAFSKFSGTDFIFDCTEFKILDLDEVLCTLTDSEDVIVPVRE